MSFTVEQLESGVALGEWTILRRDPYVTASGLTVVGRDPEPNSPKVATVVSVGDDVPDGSAVAESAAVLTGNGGIKLLETPEGVTYWAVRPVELIAVL